MRAATSMWGGGTPLDWAPLGVATPSAHLPSTGDASPPPRPHADRRRIKASAAARAAVRWRTCAGTSISRLPTRVRSSRRSTQRSFCTMVRTAEPRAPPTPRTHGPHALAQAQRAAARRAHPWGARRSGNESSLYEFYLEAANLKIIQDELRGAKAALETTDQQIEAFETKMPEYEEAAARAKAEYDGAIALKKLDSDREELERLLVWSCFNDRLRQIEENKEALQMARRSLSEIGEEQRALNEKQNSIQAEQSAACREKDDLFKQLEDVSKLGKGLKERSSKEKKEIKQAERALLAVTEDIELSKKNHEQAQLRLERQLATLEADQKAQQAELARQRTELDGEAAMLGDKISQAQRKADAIQLEHDGAVKEAEGLQREVSEADSRCRNVSEALKQIDREGFQAITRLHPRMPELMRLIQSNGGAFQCQPVGPLGLFVKVTPGNEQYAKGAEMALGGPRGLSTFVVREVHDENKLYQLAQSVGLKQYIRIVRRQPDRRFEVRERHPVTSRLNPHLTAFKTVFDVISVSDDTVFNVLIDLYNIEARLLIPTEAEATQALFKTPLSFGSNTRDRVGQLQGVVLESGASFSKKAAGLEGRVAASVQPQGVLQSDIEHAKRDLQAELQRCKAQHTEAITALQGVMVRVKALASSQVSERRDIKTLTQALRQTHVKMRQLEGETQIDPAEEVVNELREEVKTWCERIVAEQHKEVQLSAQLEALRATQAMKGDGLAEAMTRYTNLKAMYEQKQAETEQFVGPLNQCKVQMRRLEKQLHEANVAKEAAKKTIKDLEATNARDLPTLKENYGERVSDPAGRSLEELHTEMQNLRRRVTKAEKKHGGKNLYELEQQANITTSKMLEKKEELLVVTKSREGTLAAFEERYRFWQRSCKHKGKQANLDFNGRLTRKGHAGELRFDHRSQMLSLQVNRNNQDAKSSGTTDARNLSGGERSFTTLAFELSMWEFCETP
mmetsp:Transcript_27334/g.83084  ORF Transcript_27334/g.83084 Transcript_27334/m.83084 type:complete len:966 (+) Transcript_27334:623-3520(+)